MGHVNQKLNVKSCIAVAALLGALAGVAAALPPALPPVVPTTPARPAANAMLEFPGGITHDFGEIWDHQKVTRRFEFVNKGTEPLEITNASSTCGCTVSRIENAAGEELAPGQRTFKPGDKGFVVAEFDPKRRAGQQIKPIRLFLNGSTQPQYTLEIRSMVTQVVEQDPPLVFFRGVDKFGPRPTSDFALIGLDGTFDAEILDNAGKAMFKVEKVGREIITEGDKAGRAKVMFRVTALEGVPSGRHSYATTYTTTDPRVTQIDVPVSLQVLDDIAPTPSRINLGRLTPGNPFSQTFTLSSKTARNFDITEVMVEGPLAGSQATFKPLTADAKNAYEITIAGTASREARQTGSIVVKTSLLDEPMIIVPYTGWVAQPTLGAAGGVVPGAAPAAATPADEAAAPKNTLTRVPRRDPEVNNGGSRKPEATPAAPAQPAVDNGEKTLKPAASKPAPKKDGGR